MNLNRSVGIKQNINVFKNVHLNMIVSVLILLFLLTFYIFISKEMDNFAINQKSLVDIFNVFLIFVYGWAMVSWVKVNGNFVSLYFFFLIYCFFSNAGQTFLQLFDFQNYGVVNIYSQYDSNVILKMLTFQSISIMMLHSGAILFSYIKSNIRTKTTDNEKIPIITILGRRKPSAGDILFWVFSIYLSIIYIREVLVRSNYSYGDYYYLMRDSAPTFLLMGFHIMMYWYYLRNDYKYSKKQVYLVGIIVASLMLLVGSRAMVIPVIFGLLFIKKTISPNFLISRRKIFLYSIIAILSLVILGGLHDLRQYSLSSLNLETIMNVYRNGIINGIGDTIQEMGGSARTIIVTINQIDSSSVNSEMTIGYALLKGMIPTFILNSLGIIPPNIESLGDWITNVGGSKSGWGYSIIAEAYFNFQYYGFIFLGIYGFILVFLESLVIKWIHEKKYLIASALTYCLAYQIFLAREEMILLQSRMRLCIYIVIIYFMYSKLVRNKFHD
ncbi:hypothetical protein COJ46_15720 [Bacillus sp. AFS077874]|uniref:O-antigen polysaccharide polymerase Wzy n=1 Tax=Bacillus sp. AFS077874 TaxID=2033513 RepID=UPI000BF52525|nr:O-antigen polysaccharide polymerase Wzy [Bacillus sp. AFS077874]PFM78973.1 hypothetical protein COJ46_15720 [Bacillus sp. AFS077874]